MSEWMNEWMDGWMNEWMDGWTNEWMDGWMNKWMDGWDGWMNKWMDGEWMNKWMSGWMINYFIELVSNSTAASSWSGGRGGGGRGAWGIMESLRPLVPDGCDESTKLRIYSNSYLYYNFGPRDFRTHTQQDSPLFLRKNETVSNCLSSRAVSSALSGREHWSHLFIWHTSSAIPALPYIKTYINTLHNNQTWVQLQCNVIYYY